MNHFTSLSSQEERPCHCALHWGEHCVSSASSTIGRVATDYKNSISPNSVLAVNIIFLFLTTFDLCFTSHKQNQGIFTYNSTCTQKVNPSIHLLEFANVGSVNFIRLNFTYMKHKDNSKSLLKIDLLKLPERHQTNIIL
jgi:hypothetical protein